MDKKLHKCAYCGKLIHNREWLRSGPSGTITKYYHQSCNKKARANKQ